METLLSHMGLGGRKPRYPAAPDDLVIYAIGDVHGRADLLAETFQHIEIDRPARQKSRAVEILLDDLVDRGPDSAAVLTMVEERIEQGRELILLRGNHEQAMLEFLAGSLDLAAWLKLGALPTLACYGIDPRKRDSDSVREALIAALPASHLRLLRNTHSYCQFGDYVFVHAGIRPKLPMDEQSVSDLLWIREPFLSYRQSHGFIVVHGHTPVREPQLLSNRVNLDTGAYITNRLSCAVVCGDGLQILK